MVGLWRTGVVVGDGGGGEGFWGGSGGGVLGLVWVAVWWGDVVLERNGGADWSGAVGHRLAAGWKLGKDSPALPGLGFDLTCVSVFLKGTVAACKTVVKARIPSPSPKGR